MSQEAVESDHYRPKLIVKKEEKAFDTKLIERLFLRYPDLKYEPISNQKYLGRQQKGKETSAFSYAYAFITEQKKLIKAGYTLDKSFEIVEKKYQ